MSGPRHETRTRRLSRPRSRPGTRSTTVGSRLARGRPASPVAVLLVVAMVVVYVLQPLMVASQEADYPPANPLAASYGRVEPPAPRLQVDPALDIFEHRKGGGRRSSTTYGWVDRGGHRAHPDRARHGAARRARQCGEAGRGAGGAAMSRAAVAAARTPAARAGALPAVLALLAAPLGHADESPFEATPANGGAAAGRAAAHRDGPPGGAARGRLRPAPRRADPARRPPARRDRHARSASATTSATSR